MVLALSFALPDINRRLVARFPHVWDRCLARALYAQGDEVVLDCTLVARAVREYDHEAAQILAAADECHPVPVVWSYGMRVVSTQFSLARFTGNGWVHRSNSFPDAVHNRMSCLVRATPAFYVRLTG